MIQRFKVSGHYSDGVHESGDWVKYTDHLAAVAALEGENAKLRERLKAARDAMIVFTMYGLPPRDISGAAAWKCAWKTAQTEANMTDCIAAKVVGT